MKTYKGYDYEVDETGYFIYNNGNKWIDQHEPFIPNRNLSYEDNAKKQIDGIIEAEEHAHEEEINSQKNAQDITDLQLAVAELGEIIAGGVE